MSRDALFNYVTKRNGAAFEQEEAERAENLFENAIADIEHQITADSNLSGHSRLGKSVEFYKREFERIKKDVFYSYEVLKEILTQYEEMLSLL